jgi:hypothetical protein
VLLRTLIAAVAVVAVPIAVMGAQPAVKARKDSNRRICEIRGTTGSRLGAVRVCRTKAQWDEVRADERAVIERTQSRKALNGN